jgi:ribosomal protein L37AE/L43A
MAVTYTCPKCRRSLTVYVGNAVPVCTRCKKRMEPGKPKGKTA